MKKISVLVVEDSPTVRLLLEEIIKSDPRLEVLASCSSAEDALALIPQRRPDVISMDILLPGMNGLDAIRHILAEHPVPIVVVSSTTSSAETRHAIEALHAGALAVLPKPEGPCAPDFAKLSRRIADQLAAMSQVRVIRRMRPRVSRNPVAPGQTAGMGDIPGLRAIGIAASTGGPVALVDLLGSLPGDFPLPILLVQHIAPGFGESFAEWLNSVLQVKVRYPADNEPLQAGHVYLAPDRRHMAVRGDRISLLDTPPVGVHRPSANVLFESLAVSYGSAAAGIILTGMGRDGAQGLLAMKQAGAWTCGQDEDTCAVFGMPQAARDLGALCSLLPIAHINKLLLQLRPCPA